MSPIPALTEKGSKSVLGEKKTIVAKQWPMEPSEHNWIKYIAWLFWHIIFRCVTWLMCVCARFPFIIRYPLPTQFFFHHRKTYFVVCLLVHFQHFIFFFQWYLCNYSKIFYELNTDFFDQFFFSLNEEKKKITLFWNKIIGYSRIDRRERVLYLIFFLTIGFDQLKRKIRSKCVHAKSFNFCDLCHLWNKKKITSIAFCRFPPANASLYIE